MSNEYKTIRNNILNKNVLMNDGSFNAFLEINNYNKTINDTNKKLYPYQSLDMRKFGSIRFATEIDMREYMKNKEEYEKIVNFKNVSFKNGSLINFDIASDIDIYKMQPNFKYLVQQDPNLIIHLKNFVNLQSKINDYNNFIFVPYMNTNISNMSNITIEQHNIYEKINIANNKQFVSYLKSIIKDDELGKLMYEFNKLFYYYNNMLSTLSEYIDKQITRDNLIDIIIEIEKIGIYGITKESLKRRIQKRNKELEKYANSICDKPNEYNEYVNILTNYDIIKEDSNIMSRIRSCNANGLHLEKLIYPELTELNVLKDPEEYISFCKTMKFAPSDTFEGKTYQHSCIKFIDNIKNEQIKKTLNKYITNFQKTNCLNLSDQSIGDFNLLEYFMPEWYQLVSDGKIEEAFDHRQLLIGDTNLTTFFRNCTLIYRSDPFISKECDLPNLIHDIELNKIVVSCIAGNDDIFPIRIVNCNLIENINMYEQFKINNDDILMGSLSIKLKGVRTNNEYRYYNNYVYYNKNKRFKLTPVNFRSNVVIPGTIMEHVRVLYLEMNTLLYYKDDIGTQLHFYKYINNDNNFDIFVSKYTIGEIRNKYEKYNSIKDHKIYLNKLIEVKLEKDINKKFKFIELVTQNGGMIDSYEFNFVCNNDYKWNIETNNEPNIYDDEVFSTTLYKEQLNLIDRYTMIAGKEVYDVKCTPISYLKGITTPAMAKLQTKELKELWKAEGIKKKDSSGKIYDDTLQLIKQKQTVLAYKFESTLSIYLYYQLDRFLKPKYGNKYIIFSKNQYLLDGLLLYSKSVLLKNISKDIDFLLYSYKYDVFDKVINYLDVNKIKFKKISEPMNTTYCDKILSEYSDKSFDYSIIDLVIGIDQLAALRYAYIFQTQLPAIIISLQKLNKDGVMVLNINLIPNKMIFNFITFLSCFFDETFINDFPESDLHGTGQLIYSIVIFNKFKGYNSIGNDNINNLIKLNKMMYEFDDTGGYKFNINSKNNELKKIFDIKDDRNYDELATQYITNIIDIKNMEKKYAEYKEYTRMKLFGSIRNFTERMNIYFNKNIDCSKAKTMAIFLAQKYNFPLLEWAQTIPSEYFDIMIKNKFENIGYTSLFDLQSYNKIELSLNKTIICNYCNNLDKNYAVSELAYLYIEKINYDKYKGIELFINNKYKDLNKMLQETHNININGQYVSRAWIKFYELLSDTKLLDKFSNNDEINVFHICEAPGNFINSMKYYIEKNTNIKNHNWTAQSLAETLSEIYDHYGFIKKTQNKWDMGPKKTGDITDMSNLKYYLNKYGGMDFVIGDCGEKWTPNTPDNKNLTIYQMFYALLIPRVGGGFVIKSYSANFNKLYLSLLYVSCYIYESVQIFKSNTNFWSPEVYIVGKNKIKLSDDVINILLTCIEKLDNDEIIYPISELPDDFVKQYDKIVYEMVAYASDVKKFFVFLSSNDKIYYNNKDMIAKIIDNKNKGWMEKYIKS